MSDWQVIQGDCLEVLRGMPDNSVDAVVTDPPYGLAFMGKRWDYDVPSVDVWAECLRVLKPGGHLLAFAGTRTQHRMCVRIEDAGFEVRDMIAWVYGQGFPKSLDVSKAIDRMDASEEQERRRLRFTAWVRSTGVTSRQIDDATGTNMGGHYTTAASQPAIMTREHLEQCRHLLGDIPEWVERECDIRSVESRNMAEREVVGRRLGVDSSRSRLGMPGQSNERREFNVTAPATEAARQWSGWGTALKPAMEPITVARKPLSGTVAENVMEWRTGAINVDGAKVDGKRWPANLIHDGSEEVLVAFPANAGGGFGTAGKPGQRVKQSTCGDGKFGFVGDGRTVGYGDSGSAARFFYCAKASKADRGDGNRHPTVKPTDLMRYLCRLVTPPGGTVLDPFTGSGSTGRGAILEGFNFIGIEREAEYVEIARARIAQAESEASKHLAGVAP